MAPWLTQSTSTGQSIYGAVPMRRALVVLLVLSFAATAAADDPPAPRPLPFDEREGGFVRTPLDEEGDLVFTGGAGGELRMRAQGLSTIPLEPTFDTAEDDLDQTFYANLWIRTRLEIALLPYARVIGEVDAFRGLFFGDLAIGVEPAAFSRTEPIPYPGLVPRKLYATVRVPFGLFSVGLGTLDWGLGIAKNDGAHEPPFGDYDFGDRVLRLSYSVRPWGDTHPFVLSIAGHLVYDDIAARLDDGDEAYEAMLALAYEKEGRTLASYGILRSQRDDDGDEIDLVEWNAFARWDVAEPGDSGSRLSIAAESVLQVGQQRTERTLDVRTFMFAAQLARSTARTRAVLEVGYASGDGAQSDRYSRRATFDPDHQVGLLLFPELYAWSSARGARNLELAGLPYDAREVSHGAVSGAAYLFPHVTIAAYDWLEARFGAVWAIASSDVVDAYATQARGSRRSFRGGNPGNRDLGLELDALVETKVPLNELARLRMGVEGAIAFPGRAFDDATALGVSTIGTVRARLGVDF